MELWVFLNINFIVRKVIYFSVVFVPLAKEANDGVEKKEEEKDQDEDFLGSDLYRGVCGLSGCNIVEPITSITAGVTN